MKFNEIKFAPAELEILKLMQQELSVDEIIKAKAISKTTMTNHLNNIYHKTNDVVPYHSYFRKYITLRNYITAPDFEGFAKEQPRKTKEVRKKDCHSLQELLVAEFDKNKPVVADTKEEERPINEFNEAVQTDLEEVKEEEKRIFTLYEPIEKLRLQYNKQIEEWSKLIMQTKIKLEALKELERIEK